MGKGFASVLLLMYLRGGAMTGAWGLYEFYNMGKPRPLLPPVNYRRLQTFMIAMAEVAFDMEAGDTQDTSTRDSDFVRPGEGGGI